MTRPLGLSTLETITETPALCPTSLMEACLEPSVLG